MKKYVENQEKHREKHRDHHKNLIQIFAMNQTEELEDKPSSTTNLRIIKENPELKYEIIKQIGYGSTGNILMIKHVESQELFAMKRMSISSSREKDRILAEISILNSCDCPNIIKFHECYEDCKTYNLIYELMSHSLENIIDQHHKVPENIISYLMHELLQALNYLHNRSIIHRDVKSGNVLCNAQGQVKLADFGFAREVDRNNRRRSAVIGTPYYMAPEVITGSKYDFKIDIWSLGMLALELAQGKINFAENPTEIMYKTLSEPAPEFLEPDSWSEDFRSFVGRCLQKRPNERADSEELLKHPFVNRGVRPDDLISILS